MIRHGSRSRSTELQKTKKKKKKKRNLTTTEWNRSSDFLPNPSGEFGMPSQRSLSNTITNTTTNSTNTTTSVEFLTPSSKLQTSKALEELTINKLQRENLKLHGRDAEIQTLQNCFQRILSNPINDNTCKKKQFVFVSGVSGSGKSVLVQQALLPLVRKHKGVYVAGKFELFLRHQPFSGIVSVAHKICREIIHRKQQHQRSNNTKNTDPLLHQQIRMALQAAVGEDMMTELQTMLPKLAIALQDAANNDSFHNSTTIFQNSTNDYGLSTSIRSTNSITGRNKNSRRNVSMEFKTAFHFAFCAFLRVICEFMSPIVLVLDDLQWADASSFELLESILRDTTQSNAGLMMIGLYRSNEVTETHLLTKLRNGIDNMTTTTTITNNTQPTTTTVEVDQEQAIEMNNNNNNNRNNANFEVTDIQVGNLSIDSMNRVIQGLLRMEDEDPKKTYCLAELCHKKTLGNAFYGIQFMRMLVEEKKMVVYNVGLMKWTWDIDKILQKTQASDNVVGLMKQKMLHQSSQIQQTLTLCAFLGCTFEQSILELVWPYFRIIDGQQVSMTDLYEELQLCVEEGFLETSSSSTTNHHHPCTRGTSSDDGTNSGPMVLENDNDNEENHHHHSREIKYSWVHDSIQEAAFALLEDPNKKDSGGSSNSRSSSSREQMSGQIGDILLHNLSEEELDNSLFTIANLLNNDLSASSSSPTNPTNSHSPAVSLQTQFELTNINLEAAKKAANFAAFDSAMAYIQNGLRHLPQDDTQQKWSSATIYKNNISDSFTFYDLSLELHSLGAEVAACTGEFEIMEVYCSEVLQQDIPIIDRLRVYNAQIYRRISKNLFPEAAAICLSALDMCGCRLPKVGTASITASILMNIVKLKATLRNRTQEELDSMPLIEDDMKLEQMKLLDKLVTCTYHVDALKDLMPVAIFRLHNYTLKYGLSLYSPPAFATTALILGGVLEDIHGGILYANYALKLLEKIPDSNIVESRTVFLVHCFTYHWAHPLLSSLNPLLRSYEVGLRMGDTESGTYSIAMYIIICFYCGKSLETIERDCRVYGAQMLQLGRESANYLVSSLWQLVLNLSGREPSGNTVVLKGESLDDQKYQHVTTDKIPHAHFYCYQFIAYSIFGDYDACIQMVSSPKGEQLKEDLAGSPKVVVNTFHKGLAYSSKAQQQQSNSQRRKYKKLTQQASAKLKWCSKQGNPNAKHFDLILDAELAVLNGKKDDAKKLYEQGINFSVRSGYVQDAAIASERFSLFLSRDMKDYEEASYRIQEAIRYYRVWGAHKKAGLMESRTERKNPGI